MDIKQENLKVLRSKALSDINQGSKRVHSFRADFSDVNPKFTGLFTVHYPTQMERLRIGVLKATLLGNQIVDVGTENLAIVMSTLDTVIDEKPEWFDMDNIELEYEMIETVYLEYLDWVNSFRGNNKPVDNGKDSEGARSEVSMVDTEDVSGTAN